MKRLLITALLGIFIAAVPVVVLPAQPAHAVGVRFLCNGSSDLRFSPGLTNAPQTVEVLYNSSVNCLVNPLRMTSGRGTSLFTITGATCTNVVTVPNTVNYTWSPAATSSTVNYTSVSVNLQTAGALVQTGTATAGVGSGDRVTSGIALVNLNLAACNTAAGLDFISGPEELTFITPL